MDLPLDSVGGRRRYCRDAASWTRAEVARAAGLKSPSHVGLIERGERAELSAATAIALAEVFGVAVAWLVLGEGPEPTVDEGRVSSSQRPTLPAPDPAAEYLDQLARAVALWASTYARGNVAVQRMAEGAALDIRRMAVAAGVPGAQRVASSVVPVVHDEPASGTARGL